MAVSSPLLWLFTDTPEVHIKAVCALLLYMPSVPFMAINLSIISYFQALGKKWHAMIGALLDHLIVPGICAILLAKSFGDLGIFASFSVCEIITTLILMVCMTVRKEKIRSVILGDLTGDMIEAELKRKIKDQDEAISASNAISALCLENGFSNKQASLIALTVEELAINSITHGFNDNKPHALEMRAIITKESLILRLRDDGRPFNLTERYKMINPDDPTRNIGLRIIFANADDVRYNSSMNMNNVFIRINRV